MKIDSWKNWFQPHILERGRIYFDEGRVSDLERTEDGCTATVEGTEDYEVEILLEGDSIEDMFCDCPYAEDGDTCKHMAAVLFALDAAGPSQKNAPGEKERLTPSGLVDKIPDGHLRPLLVKLVSADKKLYRALLLQYGETDLDECMKTLKKELASIGAQYADRGYISYADSHDFERDMAAFIERQTQILLGRDEPQLALWAGMNALREYAGYEVEEVSGCVDDAMDAMLDEVFDFLLKYTAGMDGDMDAMTDKVFDFFLNCAGSAGECRKVRDFAEQTIFSRFFGKAFDRKKLELVDRQIANLVVSGKQGYSSEYKMQQLLMRRFDLMKELSLPKEELDAFLEQYTNYSDIRKLRVQQALEDGKMDEAVRLLEEGKTADYNKRGLVAEYSRWLMDLHEQRGQRDKLIAELEYHVFDLSSGGMEMLNRLKKACTPPQWIEYRERYLSGRGFHKLELMKSEGLWERLMDAVTATGSLFTLDRYETVLKSRYPNEMLEAYACILAKEAATVSNRNRYQELVRYLKKLKSYPGGTERTAQLAADWRAQYTRRRAMMEELRNGGF